MYPIWAFMCEQALPCNHRIDKPWREANLSCEESRILSDSSDMCSDTVDMVNTRNKDQGISF